MFFFFLSHKSRDGAAEKRLVVIHVECSLTLRCCELISKFYRREAIVISLIR